METDILEVVIAGRTFRGKFADTPAACAFRKFLPLQIRMNELNQNEKYAELDGALPAAPRPVAGGIRTGDVMLYGNECLVLFYESFRTPYTYTRLAHLDDAEDLARALGAGSVEVSFCCVSK